MSLFWTAVFLLSCQTINVCGFLLTEDPADIMNRTTDEYARGVDLRCFSRKLQDFDNFGGTDFLRLGYATELSWAEKKLGCTAFRRYTITYPPLTGMDPMMPFYINTMHQGFAITSGQQSLLNARTPVERRKEYCADMRLKIVESVMNCILFRQVRDMYLSKLYEKLCLDEDGCYNVMEYYEEDLPYCVKYSAISQFKNSSVGSWHRTIINYCKLTAMMFGGEDTKYDLKLLTQRGRKKENLRQMCLYLRYSWDEESNLYRYRLLPEEGKEQTIPDEIMDEYDTSDIETTTGTESQVGVSFFDTTTFWNMIFLTIAYA